MEQRKELDPRLDQMYMSNVRCPYCKSVISKYETTCTKCGIKKDQIFNASNQRAKEIMKNKTGEKIFMSRTRPHDISLMKMILFVWLGAFGTHNFVVGRKIRGWFFVISWIIFLFFAIIFPGGTSANNFEDIHPIRESLSGGLGLFPTDYLIVIVLIIWACDVFAVLFGFYKYPVRLGDVETKK